MRGEVRYERPIYRCKACGRYFSPVDAELGVRPGKCLTPSLTRKVAWLAARTTFEPAAADLRELLDVPVSSSEFQRVALEVGAQFEALSLQDDGQWNRPVSPERPGREPQIAPRRLALMADATNVLTVKGEEHKSVYCGRAFDAAARGRKDTNGRPFLSQSWFAASAVNFEDFTGRFLALARRCGLRRARRVAFIGDGARCLWKWARETLGPQATLIQDFWHVCEHLSLLAQELLAPAWQEAFERWKALLYDSHVDQVLDELRRLRRTLRGAKRQRLDGEIRYLEAGRERMDYVRYRRAGWPIGSGAIEGTCKYLVKQRFGVTGARWRRRNIPNLLALRVAQANGEWDEYYRRCAAA